MKGALLILVMSLMTLSPVFGQGYSIDGCSFQDPRKPTKIERMRHGPIARHDSLATIGVTKNQYIGCGSMGYRQYVFHTLCAGAFINDRWVLTTATCAKSAQQYKGSPKVRKGYDHFNFDAPFEYYDDTGVHEFNVADTFYHKISNLALIQIDRKA